jgi:oligopeptide transport system permease protein
MSIRTILGLDPLLDPDHVAAGRSLWIDAWIRLRRNRAAMVSGVFLVVMAIACVVGPFLLPHRYDEVFRDYTKVPPSLTAYPHDEDLGPSLASALSRGGANVVSFELLPDDRVTVNIVSRTTRVLDRRINEYLDRSSLFENAVVVTMAADQLTATLEADVSRELFLFGTDVNGRDMLARTLVAGRISLTIGILATAVALFVGVIYGSIAGYVGGRTDLLMMRVVDILYSLPFIFFVILLIVFFGRNWILMFVAVGAIEWLDMARIVRGQTLSLKRREYVEAAHAMGVGGGGILRRHIVPNLLGPVVVYVTLLVPKVILLESFLSFLSLGVQEPMTSWGVLISDGERNIQGGAHLLILPSIFLISTLFALNFLGDGLRDALDPRDR